MHRIDPNRVVLDEAHDVRLFANEQVFIDRKSIDEITAFTAIHDTIQKLKTAGFLSELSRITDMILTPDFHKGAGIPIGTVFRSEGFLMPRAVGSDIGCGMRFLTTDVTKEEFNSLGDRLDKTLRYIFFEGGRNIPLSRLQREMIFLDGLNGLCEMPHAHDGIWPYWDAINPREDASLSHGYGGFHTETIFPMVDFLKGSGAKFTRDDQIGSIGGGNHFCEYQVIEHVYDRTTAYFWGVKADEIAIMVHSGSVGIGHQIGNHYTDRARSLYPKALRHDHDFYVLPNGSESESYLSAMSNAANFAFANRLFLGLMMVRALSETLGRKVKSKLVYDAPHNLIWSDDTGNLHRKGACPAGHEEPVIIPGSMGTNSYLMIGQGLVDSLCSACHGAGRAKPRQEGRKNRAKPIDCRVVTKLDPAMVRSDIKNDYLRTLQEEAPDRYKDIDPVIDTVEGAGIARRVARTFPLLTVKGL